MTIETARRASLEFVCVFGQDETDPQDTRLKPVVNPPCCASETAVSLNLTMPVKRLGRGG